MARPSGSARGFDPDEIMTSALAVPFPKLDPHPPQEREKRLEAIIANLEKYRMDVRNNIINLSEAILGPNKTDLGNDVGRADDAELFRSLGTRHDRKAGDVYKITPENVESQMRGSGVKHDPRVEALLRDYNAHAQEVLQYYRERLRVEQAQRNRESTFAGGPGGAGNQGQEQVQDPRLRRRSSGMIDRARDPRMRG